MHILDLVQNSLEAGATTVNLSVSEDILKDILSIRVSDNGRGMDREQIGRVTDPFVTSRATRKFGLGLPLVDMTAKRCGGYLRIESTPGKGTDVEAVFRHSHLDRPPLGNIADTVKTIIIANPNLDFRYTHSVNGASFSVATRELTEILGEVPLTHPDVLMWLDEFLADNIANLYGGVKCENS